MLCAVISISLRRKLLISCLLTVEDIEIERRGCVPGRELKKHTGPGKEKWD